MRKAFTLIELMVTILLGSIFLSFLFRFYANLLVELHYLEAGDSLAYNAFRASQIIRNGVYSGSEYIGGVVTLKTYDDASQTLTRDDGNRTTIDISGDKLNMVGTTGSYKFGDININNFKLENVVNSLYLFKFDALEVSVIQDSDLNETKYKSYQRLVYTQ